MYRDDEKTKSKIDSLQDRVRQRINKVLTEMGYGEVPDEVETKPQKQTQITKPETPTQPPPPEPTRGYELKPFKLPTETTKDTTPEPTRDYKLKPFELPKTKTQPVDTTKPEKEKIDTSVTPFLRATPEDTAKAIQEITKAPAVKESTLPVAKPKPKIKIIDEKGKEYNPYLGVTPYILEKFLPEHWNTLTILSDEGGVGELSRFFYGIEKSMVYDIPSSIGDFFSNIFGLKPEKPKPPEVVETGVKETDISYDTIIEPDENIFNKIKSGELKRLAEKHKDFDFNTRIAIAKDNLKRLLPELPEHSINAIIGNLIQESTLNPYAYSGFAKKDSFGIAQWTGDRYDKALANLKLTLNPVLDLVNQLEYLVYDLKKNYPKVYDRLKQAKTLTEATTIFSKEYEIPHPDYKKLNQRIAYAYSTSKIMDYEKVARDSIAKQFTIGGKKIQDYEKEFQEYLKKLEEFEKSFQTEFRGWKPYETAEKIVTKDTALQTGSAFGSTLMFLPIAFLGQTAVATTLAGLGVPLLTASRMGAWTGALLASSAEATSQVGSMLEIARAEGKDPNWMASLLLNTAVTTALEKASWFNPQLRAIKNKILRNVVGLGIENISEVAQESFQQIEQNYRLKRPLLEGVEESILPILLSTTMFHFTVNQIANPNIISKEEFVNKFNKVKNDFDKIIKDFNKDLIEGEKLPERVNVNSAGVVTEEEAEKIIDSINKHIQNNEPVPIGLLGITKNKEVNERLKEVYELAREHNEKFFDYISSLDEDAVSKILFNKNKNELNEEEIKKLNNTLEYIKENIGSGELTFYNLKKLLNIKNREFLENTFTNLQDENFLSEYFFDKPFEELNQIQSSIIQSVFDDVVNQGIVLGVPKEVFGEVVEIGNTNKSDVYRQIKMVLDNTGESELDNDALNFALRKGWKILTKSEAKYETEFLLSTLYNNLYNDYKQEHKALDTEIQKIASEITNTSNITTNVNKILQSLLNHYSRYSDYFKKALVINRVPLSLALTKMLSSGEFTADKLNYSLFDLFLTELELSNPEKPVRLTQAVIEELLKSTDTYIGNTKITEEDIENAKGFGKEIEETGVEEGLEGEESERIHIRDDEETGVETEDGTEKDTIEETIEEVKEEEKVEEEEGKDEETPEPKPEETKRREELAPVEDEEKIYEELDTLINDLISDEDKAKIKDPSTPIDDLIERLRTKTFLDEDVLRSYIEWIRNRNKPKPQPPPSPQPTGEGKKIETEKPEEKPVEKETKTQPKEYGTLDIPQDQAIIGKEGYVTTSPNEQKKYKIKYVVVEKDKIIPSHTPDIVGIPKENKEYFDYIPREAQPRQKDNLVNIETINQIAKNINPDFVVKEHPLSQEGAPVTVYNKDNGKFYVISGNSRTLGLKKMTEESQRNYNEALIKEAKNLGFELSDEDIKNIETGKYILIRVLDTLSEKDLIDFAINSNESIIARYTEEEVVMAKARKIKSYDDFSELIEEFSALPDDAGEDKIMGVIADWFYKNILNPEEQKIYKVEGEYTQAFYNLLRKSLITSLIIDNNGEILDKDFYKIIKDIINFEDYRSLSNLLSSTAPSVLLIERFGGNEYSLKEPLIRALKKYIKTPAKDRVFIDIIRQLDLFKPINERDILSDDLLALTFKFIKNTKGFIQILKGYYDDLLGKSKLASGLFGAGAVEYESPIILLRKSIGKYILEKLNKNDFKYLEKIVNNKKAGEDYEQLYLISVLSYIPISELKNNRTLNEFLAYLSIEKSPIRSIDGVIDRILIYSLVVICFQKVLS